MLCANMNLITHFMNIIELSIKWLHVKRLLNTCNNKARRSSGCKQNGRGDYSRYSTVHILCVLLLSFVHLQVTSRCPPDTPIPSDEYIRLQFMPRRKNSKVAEHYTGRLQVKCMVQQRQWRKAHVDAHYGACIFWYLRVCSSFPRPLHVCMH